ncbi:MAG: hypothetical protein JSV24_08105 [Bacteroidales bacterium]|nr:MAG: hypothetical protein JSV24_08105 [Bacteroidales bacterium]
MGIPRFFSTPKPKQFNYIPRYYDEQKEALEERIREIEMEMGVNKGEAYRPRIRRGQMSNYFRRKQKRVQKQSNIRLVIIILFLLLISYFLFFY